MDSTRLLLIFQVFVQLFLLGLIFKLIWREKAKAMPALDQLQQLLERSSKLSADFSAQVERNVALMQQVGLELEARIARAAELKAALEIQVNESGQVKPYTREDVVKLARAGYAAREIAGITAIPLGEVELMINLDQAS